MRIITNHTLQTFNSGYRKF